ncbi:MAG: BON domain-containing protein [Burkholderiales bacterium]
MQARTPMYLALIAAGTVLFAAGCDQRNAATGSTSTSPSTGTSPTTTATTTAGAKIDDAAITTKVKAALMAEPGLRSLEINVDTRDNVVTLNGTVDSQEKKQRAMQLAQGVEGVKSVSDNLVVKPS